MLTGFDVPSLSTLYLDKPLKAHTLMQAIARANRVNEGKNNGMIVDYCGILKHLRRALATFAGTADSGRDEGKESDDTPPARPNEELLEELREAIALVRAFLEERGASLENISGQSGFARNAAILAAKEAANENDRTRKRFEIMCRAVFAKFKANINNITGMNQCRDEYESINIIYKSLQKDREQADISEIMRELHKIVDEVIETQGGLTTAEPAGGPPCIDISRIDFERLRREFERIPAKRGTVQNLKTAIEKRLQRLLLQNPLRTDFQKRFEEIVAEYNREKDRVTLEQTFDALLELVAEMGEEELRAKREGLDEESLAVFDLLKKPDLTAGEIKRIKTVARGLLDALKADKLRVDHWPDKEGTRDAVRQTIYDYLWNDTTGLGPPCYSEEEVQDRIDAVFLHVFRAYPTLPSPCYAAV